MNELEIIPAYESTDEVIYEQPSIEEARRLKRRRIKQYLQIRSNLVENSADEREAVMNPEIVEALTDLHQDLDSDIEDDYYPLSRQNGLTELEQVRLNIELMPA